MPRYFKNSFFMNVILTIIERGYLFFAPFLTVGVFVHHVIGLFLIQLLTQQICLTDYKLYKKRIGFNILVSLSSLLTSILFIEGLAVYGYLVTGYVFLADKYLFRK